MSRLFNTGKTADDVKIEEIDAELEAKRIEAYSLTKAEYEQRLSIGMPYKGYHIQLDNVSQNNLTGLAVKKDSARYPTSWRVLENTYIRLENASEVESLTDLTLYFLQVAHGDIFIAKDAIREATTVEEIDSITSTYIEGRDTFIAGFISSTTEEETTTNE